MRKAFLPLFVAAFLVACDGPDPDSARLYASQVDEKMAAHCQRGYEAFARRFPPPTSETRGIDAPLKSIDLFPQIFFAPLDQQAFDTLARGYPDDVRDRIQELKGALIRSGAVLKNDFARPNWQAYCDGMQQMARMLRNLG